MGNLKIHPKLGYIIGGECDKKHRARKTRTDSGELCLAYLIENKYIIETSPGWYRLKKEPNLGWRKMEELAGPGDANVKIGWYRIFQEILPAIKKRSKAFRFKWLYNWNYVMQSYELGVDAPTPFPPYRFGLAPPHHDLMYKKRFGNG